MVKPLVFATALLVAACNLEQPINVHNVNNTGDDNSDNSSFYEPATVEEIEVLAQASEKSIGALYLDQEDTPLVFTLEFDADVGGFTAHTFSNTGGFSGSYLDGVIAFRIADSVFLGELVEGSYQGSYTTTAVNDEGEQVTKLGVFVLEVL